MSNNQLKSLEDLFDGRFLRIPDYQRGYAWQEHQLNDFWEDLEVLEDEHIHYTGVLTLERVTAAIKNEKIDCWQHDHGAKDSDKSFYIVDGQQRITTTIILIQTILEKVAKQEWFATEEVTFLKNKYISKKNQNGYSSYFFGYTTDNPSYEFLKTKIFNDHSIGYDNKDTLYTANLKYAKDYFSQKLKSCDLSRLEQLFIKLTKHFKFNVYEISDDLDVFVAFETMNNRGKKLSNLELLKNRLIYLSTKFYDNDKSTLRYEINECWKTIYEYLGKNAKQTLSDDDFLKDHWIMYYDYSRERGNDYIVDLLEERFIVKNINNGITINSVSDYIKSLSTSIEYWYYIHNPIEAKLNDEIKLYLDKLHRLGYASFIPLIMAILSRDNDYEVTKVVSLLKLIEQYIFLVFRVSRRRANTGDSEFYRRAREYYKREKTLDDIIGIGGNSQNDSTGIRWWLDKYVDLKSFKIHLEDKFKNGDGYYSWSGIRYFLYEYELYLKDCSKNHDQKINWEIYANSKQDYVTIEHNFPQNDSNPYWKDVFSPFSEGDKRFIRNSLGNLLPLSRAKNSKLQNDSFADKKNGKNDSCVGYKNGSYAEQEINEKLIWTIDEIRSRGLRLIDFLIERWDIVSVVSVIENDEKESLLFLPPSHLSI